MSSKYDTIAAVFREVLELPADCDLERVAAGDDWKWDSLAHVNLVAALENELGVIIDLDRSLEITTFPAALAVLRDLGVDVGSAPAR